MKRKRTVFAAVAGLALVALAGTAVVASQRGWQPRQWLSLLPGGGSQQPVDVGLFCTNHGVPEKFCTLCHAELTDKLMLCSEHGNIPEQVCTLCHPENEQKYGLKLICQDHGVPEPFCVQCNPELAAGEAESDWCGEHGVPESLCTICTPELAQSVAMCREHGVPDAICTICKPELAGNFQVCPEYKLPVAFCPDASCQAGVSKELAKACKLPPGECPDGQCELPSGGNSAPVAAALPRVRFADVDVAKKAGIRTAPIVSRETAPTITANAEVGYDETRLAHVRPRVAGFVHEVRVRVGDSVQKGDVLAVIDSAELSRAKSEYASAVASQNLAEKDYQRLHRLSEQNITAGKRTVEAEAELARAKAQVRNARQTLRNLGLSTAKIHALSRESEEDSSLLEIVAPQDGTIIERHTVTGEAVQAVSELFAVADLNTVWVHMDIYEKDLTKLANRQPVRFQVPGLKPMAFAGTISWIGSEVDEHTRTIHVRADVENSRRLLRANMFGEAEILVGKARSALTVPTEAVQWEGSSYVVFVKKDADLYEPRRVLRGRNLGDSMELAWADLPTGSPVVTTGSFLLKTEIMKSSIGAGCCGE